MCTFACKFYWNEKQGYAKQTHSSCFFSFLFSDRQNFLNIYVMTTALQKRHCCKSNNWNQSRLWQYEINAVRKKSFSLMHGILEFGNGLLFKSLIQDFCFPQKTIGKPPCLYNHSITYLRWSTVYYSVISRRCHHWCRGRWFCIFRRTVRQNKNTLVTLF